jgi:MATE family multidrug resistance protein
MEQGRATLRSEASETLRLATPIVLTQLTMMSLGVVDLLMVGRVGVEAMNAVALGNIVKVGTLMIAMGVVLGIDPLVTQGHGARDGRAVALALQRGLVVAMLASVPVAISWLFAEPLLVYAGQDPATAAVAQDYVLVQLPSIPMFLAYSAMRQYLQGRGILRPALWTAVAANALNAGLNWTLIFGHFGAPALGAVGAGIATSVVQIAMPLILLAQIRMFGLHREAWVPWSRAALDLRELGRVLKVGLPQGAHFAAEIWGFQVTALWAGQLGAVSFAANTLVLNLSSISFMLPLGVGLASTTRVGNLVGAGRARDAQTSAWASLALGAGLMAGCAIAFLLLREQIPRLYTPDAEVVALAASTLPVAAAFQLFDGLQVVASGVLRAIGATLPVAIANLAGYYAIGLPLGWWLTFRNGLGLAGLWWGVAAGLAAVAIALVAWIARRGPLHAHRA